MMAGPGAGFSLLLLLYALLALGLVLGFCYIVWLLALKESGYIKTTGLVIACGTAALAVLLFLSGLIYGGRIGSYGMMGPRMMMEGKSKSGSMYEMMMKNPEMRRMMRRYLEEEKK